MTASTERIASVLKQARLAAGVTQAELGSMVGTDQSAISAYENGLKRPSPATVRRILRAIPPRPSITLLRHRDDVLRAASNHHASNARVFGSVARGEDSWRSDIDILVHFDPPGTEHSVLEDLFGLTADLERIFGQGRIDLHSDGELSADSEIAREAIPI